MDRSEVINLIDRDRDFKTIECKYASAMLFKHQQIIIICNVIPEIFENDDAVKSRITIVHVDKDQRDIKFFDENGRTTTRGNHLRHPPPDPYVSNK